MALGERRLVPTEWGTGRHSARRRLAAGAVVAWEGLGGVVEGREQERGRGVGVGDQDLDRGVAAERREPDAVTELLRDPVDAVDVEALVGGRAEGRPAAGRDDRG